MLFPYHYFQNSCEIIDILFFKISKLNIVLLSVMIFGNQKEMAQLLNHINEYPDAYGPDINLKYLIRHVQTDHLVQFVYDTCIFENLKDKLRSKHLYK